MVVEAISVSLYSLSEAFVNPLVRRWSSVRLGPVLRIHEGILDFSRDCGTGCACRRPTGKAIGREILIN